MQFIKHNQHGIILAPILGIMVILLALGMSYISQSDDNLSILRNDRRAQESFYIMEAGVEDAIHMLLENPSWRTGFSNKAFGNGTYTVSIQEVNSTLEIASLGKINGSRAQSSAIVATQIDSGSFKYAMQADNTINLNSSVGIIAGDINGDSVHLGNVSLQGDSSTEDDDVPTPDWNSWAAAATTTISGNYTFNSGNYSGIWYINGNVTIKSDVTFSGTIVSTGNIDFGNSEDLVIMAGDTNTAMIAQGNIQGNGAEDVYVEGLVYAAGNVIFNHQESATYYGTIFAGGNINSNNSEDISISYDADLAVNFPSYFSDPDGLGLQVLAWK